MSSGRGLKICTVVALTILNMCAEYEVKITSFFGDMAIFLIDVAIFLMEVGVEYNSVNKSKRYRRINMKLCTTIHHVSGKFLIISKS